MRLAALLLQTVLAMALLLLPVYCIDAECSACEAVAAELQQRLDSEIPRAQLDMRHRLDKDGNRYGKIINYKISEMRAVDLLEDLCSTMDSYTIITQQPPTGSSSGEETADTAGSPAAAAAGDTAGSDTMVWVKYKGEGSSKVPAAKRPTKHEEEQRQKQLKTFCGLLLERHEDEVIDALTSDKFESGVVGVLCQQISSKCKGKQYPPAEAGYESVKQEL